MSDWWQQGRQNPQFRPRRDNDGVKLHLQQAPTFQIATCQGSWNVFASIIKYIAAQILAMDVAANEPLYKIAPFQNATNSISDVTGDARHKYLHHTLSNILAR
jgi:hypothetical protein